MRIGGAVRRDAPAAAAAAARGQRGRREGARVAGRRDVAPCHAGARRVADARVAHRVVQHAAARQRSTAKAILRQYGLELPVLVCEALLVLRDVAEYLLEPENLVLERFDVELLALAMSSAARFRRTAPDREFECVFSPLSLPVQLLPPCQSGLAIRFGAAPFLRVPV